MKRIFTLALMLLLFASTAQATITYSPTGIEPDPYISPWVASTSAYVGFGTSNGSIDMDGGSTLLCGNLGVGWHSGLTGTVTASDAGTSLNVRTALRIGYQGTGIVTVENGAALTNTYGGFYCGFETGGTGTLNIRNGATVTGTSYARVGFMGTGTLNLGTDGGTAAYLNTVNFEVGYGHINTPAVGTLNAWDNTVITTTGTARIGALNNSTGHATVSAGTWNIGSYFRIGSSGVGDLTISDGGVVNVGDYVAVARNDKTTDSWLTVTGSGSQLNCSGAEFYVARNENASMTVSDGGLVSAPNADAWIGYRGAYDDGNGYVTQTNNMSATVTESGSQWQVGGALYIADNVDSRTFPLSALTATLHVDNSGVVSVGKETMVGSNLAGVNATIDFNGGTLNTGCLGANLSDLTGTGTVNAKGIITDGTLVLDEASDLTQTLSNGGSVAVNLNIDGTGTMGTGYDGSGSLTVSKGVVLESISGMIGHNLGSDGTVSVQDVGTKWVIDNVLYVGQLGAGTLDISAGAEVDAYTLCIDEDIAYEAAGAFVDFENPFSATADSVVKVSNLGKLSLAGNLTADLATFKSVILGSSDAIEILDHNLAWVDIDSAILGTDYSLIYNAGTNRTTLTALTEANSYTQGDANKDGKVDSSDMTLLANNWQEGTPDGDPSVTWEMGDFNGDFKVDSSDMTLLANNWQDGVSPSGLTVPEPSMLILLLGAMLAGWVLRKK